MRVDFSSSQSLRGADLALGVCSFTCALPAPLPHGDIWGFITPSNQAGSGCFVLAGLPGVRRVGGRGPRASGSCLCCARRVGEGGEGTSAQRGAGARHRIAPGCLETLSAVPKFSAYVDFRQPLSLTRAAVHLGGPDVCLLAWGQPPHGPGSPDHEMLPEPRQISRPVSGGAEGKEPLPG